jgi:aminoglycoside/choline kinase family phosphotransferase
LANSILQQLFRQWSGSEPDSIQALPGSGSPRKYFRLKNAGTTAIGVSSPDLEENMVFLHFTRHFLSHGLPVPEIYAEDLQRGTYLISDLGDQSLFSVVEDAKANNVMYETTLSGLYRKVTDWLVRFQIIAGSDLDYSVCYPRKRFDRHSMMWDLNYFKYYFLRPANALFDEQKLEDDFSTLTDYLSQADWNFFMYRDFQARNIMLVKGEPYFIDYQGGRQGPLQYDLASLLFQAKAELPERFRNEILDYYLDKVNEYRPVDREEFIRYYHCFTLLRLIQVLGAYGFRGLYEGKSHFLVSIPPAIGLLQWYLERIPVPVNIPEMQKALENIVKSGLFSPAIAPEKDLLTVTINSFAYKSGIPRDLSGNGGGFVFDCRALPNPGKEEHLRYFTGKDGPVTGFLHGEEEVKRFLEAVYSLVDQQVYKYMERGFKHLMVSFGCTGGQHRSVFCAEELASHLKELFEISIVTEHTAEPNWILKNSL